MAKQSKFKTGDRVECSLSKALELKVIKVLRNELMVECKQGNTFTCKKSLFEVVENDNTN